MHCPGQSTGVVWLPSVEKRIKRENAKGVKAPERTLLPQNHNILLGNASISQPDVQEAFMGCMFYKIGTDAIKSKAYANITRLDIFKLGDEQFVSVCRLSDFVNI